MSREAPVVEIATAAMGTVVSIQCSGDEPSRLRARASDALAVVHEIERTCSRFDPSSELSRLSDTVGTPVHVSPLLFELLDIAVALSAASDGAFDPTVGRAMLTLGFDQHWQTGARILSPTLSAASSLIAPPTAALPVSPPVSPPTRSPAGPPTVRSTASTSWRDIHADREHRTITLASPMRLDLNALAKGMAVDLMAQALHDVPHVSIHAGGDVFCSGLHPDGRPWAVGIRDPQQLDACIATAQVEHAAVCTSGTYERRSHAGHHHLLDPRTGRPVRGLASVSVAASTAVIADGLATAAFILGPTRGPVWLAEQHADGLFVHDDGTVQVTPAAGFAQWHIT